MANLVPLQIDKDTGRIVAKIIPGTVSGSVGLPFFFHQPTPILTWNIIHNKNTKKFMVQIFDETTFQVVFPDQIEIVDDNQINVYFLEGQAGYAHCVYFE